MPSNDQGNATGQGISKMEIDNSSLVKDSFMLIIPSYCNHSFTANHGNHPKNHPSINDLIAAFVWHCHRCKISMSSNADYVILCGWFIEALLQGECTMIGNKKSDNIGASVAAYIAFLTALEARKIQHEGSSIDTIMEGTD